MVKRNDSLSDMIDAIPGMLCWTWISIVGGLMLVTLNLFWTEGPPEFKSSMRHSQAVETRKKMRKMKMHGAPTIKGYSTSGALAF